MPVPNRTRDRFPSADVLVEYLRDFAVEQEAAARIQYNTTVLKITRENADEEGSKFLLALERAGSDGAAQQGSCSSPDAGCDSGPTATVVVVCGVVVHAGGIWTPNKPQNLMDQGFDLATTYSELPRSADGYAAFDDKKVAIFGLGNAAMESADRFAPHTAFVHTFPGRGEMKFPHFAYETRYVGNVRTWRSQIIDSYVLKSLDGGFPTFSGEGVTIRRCGDNLEQKCLFVYDPKAHTVELAYQEGDEASFEIVRQLHSDGCVFEKLLADQQYGVVRSPGYGDARTKESLSHGHFNKGDGEKPEQMLWPAPGLNHPYVTVNASCITEEVATRYSKLAGLGGMDPYPLVYDSVVLCVGFRHDLTLYGSGTASAVEPIIQSNGRYPVLTDAYEAVGEPGLYFAGALAHGRDYRRAAGGFIHGFRYTARALVTILAERHKSDPVHWPTVEYPGIIVQGDGEAADDSSPSPAPHPAVRALSTQLLDQINEGSAPYQMVHVIGDGVVFHCNKERTEINATYFKETPLSHFNQQYRGLPRFTTGFGYNGQTRKLEVTVRKGTQFKVFVWFYPGDCTRSWKDGPVEPEGIPDAVEHRELLEFRETLSTQYSSHATLPILDAFILDKSNQLLSLKQGWAAPGPQPSADHTQNPVAKTLQDVDIRTDDFGPGRIDIWVKNLSPSPVLLYSKAASDTGEKSRKIKWRKHAGIEPGDGLLLKTQHLDNWKAIDATTTTQVSKTLVADLAKGIVQDWLVGYDGRKKSKTG